MTKRLQLTRAFEFQKTDIPDKPQEFFGYIDENGYIALKIYTTNGRYEELKESDNLSLFINKFKANNYKDAKHKIRMLLINTLSNEWELNE